MQKILKHFYKFYPNLKNNIDFCIVGTPVTNEYYLNSKDGCSYGLEHNTDRASDYVTLRPETPIKGLYLTGQDITSAGTCWCNVFWNCNITQHFRIWFKRNDF